MQDSASPTPPSSVFPIPIRDTTNFRPLEAPGTRLKVIDGYRNYVIELRGWLRAPTTSCNDAQSELEGTGPDWSYNLELDPAWTDSIGATLNQILHVGDITEDPAEVLGERPPEFRQVVPAVKIELASWRVGGRVHRGAAKPTDWVFQNACRADEGDTFWPYDPDNPLPWQLPLLDTQYGRYVRVVGSLITDAAHGSSWTEAWGDEDARHTEIHSPDIIEILPDRDRTEIVQGLVLYAQEGRPIPWDEPARESGVEFGIQLSEPPSWAQGIDVQELVLPGTNFRSIVDGNDARDGARITINEERHIVTIKVTVRGEENWGAPGKFAAIYRVRYRGAPPPLRITPERDWMQAQELEQFRVDPDVPVRWAINDLWCTIDERSGLFRTPDVVDPGRFVTIAATEWQGAHPFDPPRMASQTVWLEPTLRRMGARVEPHGLQPGVFYPAIRVIAWDLDDPARPVNAIFELPVVPLPGPILGPPLLPLHQTGEPFPYVFRPNRQNGSVLYPKALLHASGYRDLEVVFITDQIDQAACEEIQGQIDVLQAEIVTLQAQLNSASAAERPLIIASIREDEAAIEGLRQRAQRLGCS
jgi:hypothetical protein